MVILGIAFSLVPSALWPAVAKIFPVHQLGTAYALIFFIQNIGLWGVPNLIGTIQEHYCVVGRTPQGASIYDYTLPMLVFCGLNSALLHQVLEVLRLAQLPPIAMKAVLTETNLSWDTHQLYEELLKEREAIAAQKAEAAPEAATEEATEAASEEK